MKYRVAVIGGAGVWGRRYLKAYCSHPQCEIVALVDCAEDRREAFAQHYGVSGVFDSLDSLLRRELPDIVSISLPVSQSPAAVLRCAQAGVKVISCEKPIAVTLTEADAMVKVCREQDVALACGTAFWEVPYFLECVDWIQANIGKLVEAAIPGGLPQEVSGGGCPQLVMLRRLAGMEVEWVQGWTVPPEAAHSDVDCTAYGRLGFSGSVVCEIPPPAKQRSACSVSVRGENGSAWLTRPRPVLVQGRGLLSSPVCPSFFDTPPPENFMTPTIERLLEAFRTDGPAMCSGHDYRQALEIAIALKLSARHKHERIELPLEDRSLGIKPQPHRLLGGDAIGWENSPYQRPPEVF